MSYPNTLESPVNENSKVNTMADELNLKTKGARKAETNQSVTYVTPAGDKKGSDI